MLKRVLAAIGLAVVAAAGVAYALGHDDRDAEAAAKGKPPVVLLMFDEFPADLLLGPNGRIDAGRYPAFAELARSGYWFPNATTTYDSTTKAIPQIIDGRYPAAGRRAGLHRPSAQPLRRLRSQGLRDPPRRGRDVDLPAALVPRRAARPAGDPDPAPGGPARAAGAPLRLDPPDRRADLLARPHPAAARAVHVPAVGQADARRLAGPDRRDEQHARLLLRLPGAPRPAAAAAPDRLRRPRAGAAVRADAARGDLRQVADRRDRRPRDLVGVGRGRAGATPTWATSTSSRRCRCSSRRRARSAARWCAATCGRPTSRRRSPTCVNARLPYPADGRSAFSRTRARAARRDGDQARLQRPAAHLGAPSCERRRGVLLRARLRRFGSGDWDSLYTGIGPSRAADRAAGGRAAAASRPSQLQAGIAEAVAMRTVKRRLARAADPDRRGDRRRRGRHETRADRGRGQRHDRGDRASASTSTCRRRSGAGPARASP